MQDKPNVSLISEHEPNVSQVASEDEPNVSQIAREQKTSCWASKLTWLRERLISDSPPTSINFVREVITLAGLRAQLERQDSATKSSSLNVEFLAQEHLIPAESDWSKARVIRVQPDGLVDVKMSSGDHAGTIVEGIPVKRLRGRRACTASVKIYYGSGFAALLVSYLLLIPLHAFPRYCPLMHGRGSPLHSGWSSSSCISSTGFRNGNLSRRMPIETCAANSQGDRAFINWLSNSSTGVLEELKNPLCRLDPDILFKCAKIGLGLYSHALAAQMGSTIEVPRPTREAWVVFPFSNVALGTFWYLAATSVPFTWIDYALLIIFEFLWAQALILLPLFWSFWQRGAMGGGHILEGQKVSVYMTYIYCIAAGYVVLINMDLQGRYGQLIAWRIACHDSTHTLGLSLRTNASQFAQNMSACAGQWHPASIGGIDYFHGQQTVVGPWEFSRLCTETLQRMGWAEELAASLGTPFFIMICISFLLVTQYSVNISSWSRHVKIGTGIWLVYVFAGPVQQLLFTKAGSMPLPFQKYSEAAAPTLLKDVLFFSHIGIAMLGLSMFYQLPMLLFVSKQLIKGLLNYDVKTLEKKLAQAHKKMRSTVETSSRKELMRSFTPLIETPAAAVLLNFEKSLDFEIGLEGRLESGMLIQKLCKQEQLLFKKIEHSLKIYTENTENSEYVEMLKAQYQEKAAPHRCLYEDALEAIRGHSRQAFDNFVEEADDVAEYLGRNGVLVQTTQDPSKLLADARKVKPVYDAFIRAVASKSAGRILHSKIKGRYRIAEKIALRPPAEKKRFPGACRVRDVVRGAIVYGRMSELHAGFQLIVQSDVQICEKTYSDAEAAGLTTRIVMRGVKNRFGRPTTAGWADCMIAFSLKGDDNKHICELQLIHQEMMTVRRECGAHDAFCIFRSAAELLESGKHKLPPINQIRRRRSSLQIAESNSTAGNSPAVDPGSELSVLVSNTQP